MSFSGGLRFYGMVVLLRESGVFSSLDPGPYSLTNLKNVLLLVMQIYLYFEGNITSDWLNNALKPVRICVTFKFTKS